MKYITKCIFEAFEENEITLLLHCCNMQNNFGKGIAKDIKELYPIAYAADTEWFNLNKSQLDDKMPYLGRHVRIYKDCSIGYVKNKAIVNLYGQMFYGHKGNFYNEKGRQLNYGYLALALKCLSDAITPKTNIGIPYLMGCDKAGGDWSVVEDLISTILSGHNVIIYDKFDKYRKNSI